MNPELTAVAPESERPEALFSISVSAIAWAVTTAGFLLLRLGTIWHTPVGGAELVHLSGAWQARIGVADDRFVPTLFQALTTLLLHISDSAIPARIVAFAATATIPAAVWFLRPRLGEAGALIALLLLAFDGPAISLGTSASAMGFDLAIAAWLFVAIGRKGLRPWTWAAIGFLVATAGPIPLVLALGAGGVALARREYPDRQAAAWGAGGAIVGNLAASARFGMGFDGGLRVPPFALFAASFDQMWSTANSLEITALYVAPVVAAGLAAAVLLGVRLRRRGAAKTHDLVLLAWAGVALLWLLVSGTAHSPAPVVALTLPLALLAGPALAEGVDAMVRADWRYARFLVPIALFAAAIALVFMLTWARNGQATDNGEKLLVTVLLLLALVALGAACWERRAVAALLAPALVIGVPLFVSAGMGVSFSSSGEPVPSPVSPVQARQLRDTALQLAHEHGGLIVVHERFAEEMTWPFRDSGDIVVASRVPGDASVVVWPKDLPRPDGYNAVDVSWNLLLEPDVPTDGFLAYLKWLSDRASLGRSEVPATVYVKASQ